MNIIRGRQQEPERIVIYGPEGIGKTSLAAKFPDPLFLDVEAGTGQLDVARTDRPKSWSQIKGLLMEFAQNHQGFRTLVIDTADWAEKLLIADICASHNLSGLGGNKDYGHSYDMVNQAWAKALDFLTEISERHHVNIVMLAHAKMRKFELPEEAGAFDRWELKLQKGTAALLKEWATLVLFLNYKTIVVEVEKTKKAQGSNRVMYATHHACWDAKQRPGHNLPDEMPLDYQHIAHIFSQPVSAAVTPPPTTPQPVQQSATPHPATQTAAQPTGVTASAAGIPANLAQLMQSSGATEAEVRTVVAKQGYYPVDTPIVNYDAQFIEGVLVAKWEKVFGTIQKTRSEQQ